ncbi:hypothetical protein L202_06218 [Cryptococcus amylolentus CBS 6039]|uniref:Uncharacterized protein n=1 Tax=Cryptococcus amylolentus CBS 6039 TaxID=1295533 RepID=A0A1E3HIW2_9TREE|nr:hypothetical protein L202_06218 [Cryptococcus amylolentus CBS 6039]ODN76289.1 hypothetical protein L202_06218 [Cryptococcus amylolentus CBS 6039]
MLLPRYSLLDGLPGRPSRPLSLASPLRSSSSLRLFSSPPSPAVRVRESAPRALLARALVGLLSPDLTSIFELMVLGHLSRAARTLWLKLEADYGTRPSYRRGGRGLTQDCVAEESSSSSYR